jgi:hypothetical protein
MLKQFSITPSCGKRLIGKAFVVHPAIKEVLEKGILVIIAGTTNGYIAEEILNSLGYGDKFSRTGFRRGIVTGPNAKIEVTDLSGDVVLQKGKWLKGKTIFEVVDDLKAGDIILKGANALDSNYKTAVLIGDPKSGTIGVSLMAIYGRRVRLIVPVGLEKTIIDDIDELVDICNSAEAVGTRLLPLPGETFTELEAIKLLSGADAFMIAAGGIYGAEGSVWLGIEGDDDQVKLAEQIIRDIENEPPCKV